MNFETDLLVIFNLIIIESLLSIDNAAVLATLAMELPKEDRPKALRFGLLGAYFFRGLALVFATFLVEVWWLKVLGGVYLLYLCYDYFTSKSTPQLDDDTLEKYPSILRKYIIDPVLKAFNFIIEPPKTQINNGIKKLGKFWYTVILIEIMDMAFSVDNVFAAVAFTQNIYLICIGVFIGILAMRFVAQYFIVLMEKYAFLEKAAFIVIGILGFKLSFSLICHYGVASPGFCSWMESEHSEWLLSSLCLAVFVLPILTSYFFGFPAKGHKDQLN